MIEKWHLPADYLDQTIAQIEKLPPATIHDGNHNVSGLTRRVFRIEYETKLKDMTGEDLGCMLGQQFSLELIVPVTIAILQKDIMAEGYYEGHLIEEILSLPPKFWQENPLFWQAIDKITAPHKDKHKQAPNSKTIK